MVDDKAKKTSKAKCFFWGKDQGYYDKVLARLSTLFPSHEFESSLEQDLNKDPQKVFVQVIKEKTDMLFIDFSKNTDNALRLTKLMRRDNRGKLISTTALHDYLTDDHTMRKSLLAGARLNQIKSGEIESVAYQAGLFFDLENILNPGRALAKFQKKTSLKVDLRLAYMTETHFRVETNTPFTKGQMIVLENNCLSKVLKSHYFIVSKVEETNLYYDRRYAIYLDYTFIPPKESFTKDANKKEADLAIEGAQLDAMTEDQELTDEEREDLLKVVKKEVKEWVFDRFANVKPKKTKILIIDNELKIFDSIDKRLSDYDYTINVQTKLVRGMTQVKRTNPHIIAFVYNPPPKVDPDIPVDKDAPEIDPFDFNGGDSLANLIHNIKKTQGYEPIVTVFNAKHKSETLQDKLSYEKIISYPDDPSMKIILSFASILQKKNELSENKELQDKLKKIKESDPRKYANYNIEDLVEKRVYFKADDANSVISTSFAVNLLGMTEHEVYFESDHIIPEYTVFSCDFPIDFYITIIPHKSGNEYAARDKCYRGLINALGEKEKMELRKFINSIFFAEKKQQQEAEQAEFKALNDKAQEEKGQAQLDAQKAIENEQEAKKD